MKEVKEMNSASIENVSVMQKRSRGWLRTIILNPVVCSALATLGIFGGISSLLAGLICITIHVAVQNDTVFDGAGTILLILGIPLLLLGSVFLDEIEVSK